MSHHLLTCHMHQTLILLLVQQSTMMSMMMTKLVRGSVVYNEGALIVQKEFGSLYQDEMEILYVLRLSI